MSLCNFYMTAINNVQVPPGPDFRTQEEFHSSGHQSAHSRRPSPAAVPAFVFPSSQRPARSFQTPHSGGSVTQDHVSSQGSCPTAVPDTPDGSADVDMGEMELLSQVLGRVELAGNPMLQHHFAEIQRLMRNN